MLAGLLHQNGISMGTHFRPPLPENPKGFFEEEAFRVENERILLKSGYTVEKWHPLFRGISLTNDDLARARALIVRFDGLTDSWGWKDPRTCLTLPMWLTALQHLGLEGSARVIVIRRSVRSVARSLRKRGNVKSLDHGAAICRLYNRELNRALGGWVKRSVLCVCYERLVQRLDIDRLESFCGRRLDASFVDSTLNRSAGLLENI
jgi:hypothetical protein